MKNQKQIVAIWAENKTGVLGKILSLCRRRMYSLKSVNAGSSHKKNIYHITLVFEEEKNRIQHIIHQINKIIEVLSISVVEEKYRFDRELALILVKDKKTAEKFCKLTIGTLHMTIQEKIGNFIGIEVVGEEEEIDQLVLRTNKNDIVKMVRSGVVAVNTLKE